MKLRFSLAIATIFLNFLVHAQSPNWAWAKRSVSASNANGNGITSDASGNVYVTGNFMAATITFGTVILTNDTAIGTDDIFVVKYDASGNVVWAKSAGGIGQDNGYKVATDASGNVYVTGYFQSPTIIFGNDTLVHTGGGPNNDVFLLKYDAAGNPVWARSGSGTDYDQAQNITTDLSGNVYITGYFQSIVLAFDNLTINNSNTNGSGDYFIAKYDGSGNIGWAQSAGGVGPDYGYGLTSDFNGDILATGSFQSPSIVFGTYTLTNNGSGTNDILTVKYDAAGNILWAKQVGGSGYEDGNEVATDALGNVFVIGSFSTTPYVVFANDTLLLNNGTASDILVLKYDPSGNPVWGRGFGGVDSEYSPSISTDATGNSYASCPFQSQTIIFGPSTLTNAGNLSGTPDVFVGKYDALGNPLWAKSSGGIDFDYGNDITVDANGKMSLAGNFQSTSITFGTTTLPNSTFGSATVYTASMDRCSPPLANICMATADSLSKFNIIVWDKTSLTNVDSFIVYREITTNNYQRIGAQPYSALSQFVDTVRTLYFPNTGDPNGGTYRYKLQTFDTCGNYSPLSPFHNTIYMTNNNGTFSWPQLYTIENGPNPVNAYVLMRDDNNTGVWHAVNSVAGTQQSVTDPAYSSFVGTANWRIQTLWSITCTPTLKYSNNVQSFSSSHSNLLHTLTSVNELSINNLLNIFPNPSGGKFNIDLSDAETKISNVEIYNAIGQNVFQENYSQTVSSSGIDISSKPNGIYFVCVKTTNGVARKKIIIQK